MRLSAATLVALLLLPAPSGAEETATDSIRRQVPSAGALPFQPEFQFSFGFPARWPSSVLHWRYNAAGAPLSPSPFANEATTVAALASAAGKWSAICGIQFVYDGPTTTAPYNGTDPAPDGVNVIGWRELSSGTLGLTYTWNASSTNPDVLVDADILFVPSRFSAPPPSSNDQMDRTAAHEWGHAIGLNHSNVPGALMSGLPDSPYSYLADPQPDDIRACRCLYGAAPGQAAAYACSLPTVVDFGVQTVGQTSASKRIDFVNDISATQPLSFGSAGTDSSEFVVTATTCVPSSLLAPGAGCTIDVAARPGVAGTRTADAVINTSDGIYRVPLTTDGYAPPVPPPPPAAPLNVQGLWWNAPAGSESGWGINFAHQGDTIFASWFTYDTTGRAWWLVMTANKTGANTYSGTLYTTRGPAFNAVPWSAAAVSATAAGTGTLVFSDANNGTFSYTVGAVTQAKAITRQVFGPLPTCVWNSQPDLSAATNYQDLWWASPAASESGWGINLNHEGNTIFATWFTYDLDGSPLWLVATANQTADPKVFSGTLYRTSGPRFDAFNPATVVNAPVGFLTLTFTDGNHATMSYTVQVAGMASPAQQMKPITREIFSAPGTACR